MIWTEQERDELAHNVRGASAMTLTEARAIVDKVARVAAGFGDDTRWELRRARFHEVHNYDRWQVAETRLATLFAEVREIRDRCDNWAASNADVRTGIDLVVSRLDVLLTRYEVAGSEG